MSENKETLLVPLPKPQVVPTVWPVYQWTSSLASIMTGWNI